MIPSSFYFCTRNDRNERKSVNSRLVIHFYPDMVYPWFLVKVFCTTHALKCFMAVSNYMPSELFFIQKQSTLRFPCHLVSATRIREIFSLTASAASIGTIAPYETMECLK